MATSFAGNPKFQVESIMGLFLFFLSIFDFANTLGDEAPANPAIKNLRLLIFYLSRRSF